MRKTTVWAFQLIEKLFGQLFSTSRRSDKDESPSEEHASV